MRVWHRKGEPRQHLEEKGLKETAPWRHLQHHKVLQITAKDYCEERAQNDDGRHAEPGVSVRKYLIHGGRCGGCPSTASERYNLKPKKGFTHPRIEEEPKIRVLFFDFSDDFETQIENGVAVTASEENGLKFKTMWQSPARWGTGQASTLAKRLLNNVDQHSCTRTRKRKRTKKKKKNTKSRVGTNISLN